MHAMPAPVATSAKADANNESDVPTQAKQKQPVDTSHLARRA